MIAKLLVSAFACAIAAPAGAGIQVTAQQAPAYSPLAKPICAPAEEIDARMIRYGFSEAPRSGLSGPSRDTVYIPVAFMQEWSATKYFALVRGDRRRACVVAVAKR